MRRGPRFLLPFLLALTSCVHAQQKQGLGGTGGASGIGSFQSNVQPPFGITTGSLPSGTLNQAGYIGQITAQNGIPPYNCSLSSGSLPGGLQLVGCSIIGTPTAPAGTNTFSITVTDSATPTPNSATASYTINIGCPAPSILPPTTLPVGQQGTSYSFQFQSTGGIAPINWASSGTLCSGLSPVTSGGILAGTPSTQQICNFTVSLADSCNLGTQTASENVSLQINTNIAVTTTSLPAALAGTNISDTLSVGGGTGPYTWTLQAGSTLPGTLVLAPSTGVISGSVAIDGTYNFTVRVTDSLNATATQALSLTVTSPPIQFLTQSPLPSCTQTQNYPPFQMQASGGVGTLTYTAPGLASVGLAISSSGLITGTCTQIGVFNPTITITDQSLPTAQTVQQAFQITMKQNIGPLVFNDTTLAQATAGVPYSAGITVSGGIGPYSFNTTPLSGHFPAGLTLSSNGTVSGTATVAETDSPDIQVSDSENPPQTAHSPISITSVCPAITSTSGGALPPAKQGTAYSAQVSASGGYGTLSYSIAGQPSGLSINSTGLISGTPSVSGAFPNIVVTATDQCSPTPQTFPINLSLQVNTNLAITTGATLPTQQVGVAVSIPLSGSGGTPPYTWTSSTLPAGLSISGSNIVGTPTTAGTFTNVSITLTDSVPNSVSATFSITINPAQSTTPALPNPALLNWNTNISNTPSPGTVRCVGSPGVTCGATYATIPLALAAASCGDTIVLQNTQYVITSTLTFNATCNAADWLTITRDTSDATFPAELNNVNPCSMGLLSSTLVGLPAYTCTSVGRHMPQIEKSGSGAAINVICSYCRFIGIEWTRDNTYSLDTGPVVNMSITSCTNPDNTCMNAMPTNIIFDRNIFHGDAQRESTRAIGFSGTRWVAVLNSYCYDFGVTNAGGGGDAQCFQTGTGHNFTNQGFYKFINDFVSASTMAQLTGGSFTEPLSPTTGFDGVTHDLWNAYWWAYKNPLWDTNIGQTTQSPIVIEGNTYNPAPDQALTVTPTALSLAESQSFQFQLLLLNDSAQGINRATIATTTATLTCGTAGACGSVTSNFTNVGTGIHGSQNQILWTYTAPASIPSGNTVTVNFCTTVTDTRSGTLANNRSLCASSTVTVVASSPAHIFAVSPVSANLRIQPSYSDANFNTRQFCMIFYAIPNFTSSSTTWAVDNITGGNSTVGTIDTSGLYCSPSTAGTHTIKATASDSTTGTSAITVSTSAPIVGFDLKAFTAKNGYEFKECKQCLVENMLIENCWGSQGNGGGQPCSGMLFQPINQNNQVLDGSGNTVGYGPQTNTDITVRYVKIVHAPQGLVNVSLSQALGTHRVSFTNILGDDINYKRWGNGFSRVFVGIKNNGSLSTSVLGWTSQTNPQFDHVTYRHITLVGQPTQPFDIANNLAQFQLNNLTIQDSIIAANGSQTFIDGGGEAGDCDTATGAGANNTEAKALVPCFNPYTFNHLQLSDSTANANVFTSTPIWQFASTNIGFVNYNGGNGGDYRLCKTSLGCSTNSIFGAGQANQASDGTDLGADITGLNAVEQTIRGVTAPPPNTFYVSTTGNDSNPGTLASPWLTIGHAIATATAGQTVLVENGTYTQSSTLVANNSGVLGQPITFQSQNKYGAVIQAGSFSGQIISVNASYVTFQNFEIIGNSSGTNNDGIKFQSPFTGGQAIGNKIHQIGTGNCSGGAPIISAQTNAVISGNEIYDYGEASCNQYEGIYLNDGNGQTVTNNLLIEGIGGSSSATIGIQVNGQQAQVTNFPSNQNVSNNTIANTTSWCTLWASWSGTAANNNFNNNVCYTTGTNGSSGSVRTANNGGGFGANSFANNLINNSGSSSMAAGTSLTGTVTSAPQFVNYTGDQTGDYHPCASNGSPVGCTGTSPLIGAGVTSGAPAIDFDGFTRTPPEWIGAYQNSQ